MADRYIPAENAALRGSAQVTVDLVRRVAAQGRRTTATLDHDATIQESHKREARQRGFAALPETVTTRYFRADSACYDERVLQWLADTDRAEGATGAIGSPGCRSRERFTRL